jgi:hypothetical protein
MSKNPYSYNGDTVDFLIRKLQETQSEMLNAQRRADAAEEKLSGVTVERDRYKRQAMELAQKNRQLEDELDKLTKNTKPGKTGP